MRSLPFWRPSLSLRNKLFAILILFSVLPSLLVYAFSQFFMIRSSAAQSSASASLLLESVSGDFNKELSELNQSINSLIVDYYFQQYLTAAAQDYARQARLFAEFKTKIDNVLDLHPQLTGVLYTDSVGKKLYVSYQHYMNYGFQLDSSPYYGMKKLTSPELSAPHPADYMLNSPAEVFTFTVPVRNLMSGSYSAHLYLELKADYILSKISGDGRTEGDASLYLYHRSSRMIIPGARSGGKAAEALRSSLLSDKSLNLTFRISGDTYEAVRQGLGYGEWDLVWAASMDELSSGVRRSRQILLLITALSLAAAILIAFPTLNAVWKPVNRLKSSIQSLSQGIYAPVPGPAAKDEIGHLIRTFNRMLVDLQRLEQEIVDGKLKEKERELLQLQAQINPHFFFNTLEAIDSYAGRNDSEAVEAMVQCVSRMMRYNVRNDGGWAPLREELEYIRIFLDIHRYRSGAEVQVVWNINPLCLEMRVLKLSLQPFVENALKYGWTPEGRPENCSIEITVVPSGHGVEFTIQDTGTGMPAEIAAKLNELAASRGETSDPFFVSHTGIFNVCRRLYLAHGDHVRLEFQSARGKGTRIFWRIGP